MLKNIWKQTSRYLSWILTVITIVLVAMAFQDGNLGYVFSTIVVGFIAAMMHTENYNNFMYPI